MFMHLYITCIELGSISIVYVGMSCMFDMGLQNLHTWTVTGRPTCLGSWYMVTSYSPFINVCLWINLCFWIVYFCTYAYLVYSVYTVYLFDWYLKSWNFIHDSMNTINDIPVYLIRPEYPHGFGGHRQSGFTIMAVRVNWIDGQGFLPKLLETPS